MKFDKRIALIILAIFVPAILIARTYLLVNSIDINTGFYIGGSELSQNVYRILTLVSIIFVIFIAIFGKSRIKASEEGTKINPYNADLKLLSSQTTIFFGTLSAIMAVLLFGYSVKELFGGNVLSTVKMLEYVSMLASSVVFAVLAIKQYMGKPLNTRLGYAMLIPVIWVTIRSALIFKNFIIITSKSQNLLVMLFVLSWLVFVVEFARLYSGLEKKSTRPIMIIMGTLTFVFGMTETLPVYFFTMIKSNVTLLPFDTDMLLIDFVMALFALGSIIQLLGPNITISSGVNEEKEENQN